MPLPPRLCGMGVLMKIYRSGLIVWLLAVASASIGLAEHAQNDEKVTTIAVAATATVSLTSQYVGEGHYDFVLTRNGVSTVIWRSYCGYAEAQFSSDGKYLAVLDDLWFDTLGPVLIFRLAGPDVQLVYQSPGNFDQEEDHFVYGLGGFVGNTLRIKVYSNDFSEKLSRAKRVEVFQYAVDCSHLRPRAPSYYDRSDRLYFNVNEQNSNIVSSGASGSSTTLWPR
jgi:hypothetical protein